MLLCSNPSNPNTSSLYSPPPQQIDELLAGGFTQEDEDAVLQELDDIIKVGGPWPHQVWVGVSTTLGWMLCVVLNVTDSASHSVQ